jgi:ABC-type multidrug transport system fused ATPase/permease subunit
MPPKKQKTRKTSHTTTRNKSQNFENRVQEIVRSELVSHQSQKSIVKAYIQQSHEFNAKSSEYIQKATREIAFSYRLSIVFSIIGYVAALGVLVGGLFLAKNNINSSELFIVGLIFMAAVIMWFISLQTKNLFKNTRHYVNNLAKLNIIFASYLRQIHQMDIVFQGLVKNEDGIAIQEAEQLLTNLQEVMTEALSAVTQTSSELDE